MERVKAMAAKRPASTSPTELRAMLRGVLVGFFVGICVGAYFVAGRSPTPAHLDHVGPVRLWLVSAGDGKAVAQ